MQSSSTTLLQKTLTSKLEPWVEHVNGKGQTYTLDHEQGKIIINEYMQAGWIFPVVTLILNDNLHIDTRNNNNTKIEYSDPNFYKNVFEALNKAIKFTGVDFIVNLTQIVHPHLPTLDDVIAQKNKDLKC